MKKQLLTIGLVIASVFASQAQYVLTKNTPPFGATFTMKRITGSVAKPTLGQNQTWDYSTVTGSTLANYVYIKKDTVSQALKDSFPTTTLIEYLPIPGAPDFNLNPMVFIEEKPDFFLRLGVKSSGTSMQRVNDTMFYFNHAYDSTIYYGSQYTKYAGYGSLKLGAKTYDTVVVMQYINTAQTDTTLWFITMKPYYQRLLGMGIKSDTVAAAFFYETGMVTPNPTGVNETALAQTKVYPNPVTTHSNIQLENVAKELTVAIYDVQGKLVLKHTFSNTALATMSTESLQNGMYFMQIDADGLTTTRKIIKQ
jgi:hypothetical protein